MLQNSIDISQSQFSSSFNDKILNFFKPFFSHFYDQKVIDHFKNPRNVGTLNAKDKSVGTGMVGAPACGDVMRLQIKVNKDGIIEDAVFKTFGCGSAIASSSYATELLKGKTLNDAVKIKNKDISSYLKLPPVKLHCSLLAEEAIKIAVDNYKKKNLL